MRTPSGSGDAAKRGKRGAAGRCGPPEWEEKMERLSADWLAEIDRRAEVYEAIGEEAEGRMTVIDYLGIAALMLFLTIGFWTWVA